MDFDRLIPDSNKADPAPQTDGIRIPSEALSFFAAQAFDRISFTFSKKHLEHLVSIVHTEDNSYNDRLVASMLLENACISSNGVYPLCQDTGTAQVFAWKDSSVQTDGDDTVSLGRGIEQTYTTRNLRFSTTIPTSLFEEKDPLNNMPAQILLNCTREGSSGPAYRFLFCAKGGGSSNKTSLVQGTKALLNDKSFTEFLQKQIPALGTSACPPYTIAVVVGGLSPEQNLLALKLATAGYFDENLAGWDYRVLGTAPIRDGDREKKVLEIAAATGLGAQFGGSSFAVEARVLRLPRHGASCPVSVGVSCSAHRNLRGYIDGTGMYLESTVSNPLTLPGLDEARLFSHRKAGPATVPNNACEAFSPRPSSSQPLPVDLDRGIASVRKALAGLACGTPVILSGKLIIARDAAHARWRKLLSDGKKLPQYTAEYTVFYAGPAETPEGCACGSIGPTTAGRMDDYADDLMKNGASLVTLAKGNRGEAWRNACLAYGGTYLGTVGGAAALIAEKHITDSAILDYGDLGMEAVRLVTVRDLPAFVLINDRGEDFYQAILEERKCP